MKYLYGAAVQGIQGFIFQTNELKDIVGASELVEHICTDLFTDEKEGFIQNGISIINAAGNIKCIYNTKKECEYTVRNFPKKVTETAPGITISQAVVKYDETKDFATLINELEEKLKVQRNKPMTSITLGLIATKRYSATVLPIDSKIKTEFVDGATFSKLKFNNVSKLCAKSFYGDKENIPASKVAFNISDITGKNDWIAVVHADGNELGKVVQNVGGDKENLKIFSKNLNEATICAANDAFKVIEQKIDKYKRIPIRPIVLGGDDLTVIIRADLAIDYVTEFMRQFEKHTEEKLKGLLDGAFDDGSKHLTACAGIAFIKSSYPFYYGYNLAEELCSAAKKDAKLGLSDNGLAKACLMFHKVQDSFVTSYKDIVERELEITLSDKHKISFQNGPYYLSKTDNKQTIEDLKKQSDKLDGENNSTKTTVRQWLTLLHSKNTAMADQKLKRAMSLLKGDSEELKNLKNLTTVIQKEDNIIYDKYPAYDVLAYHTIMNQYTKGVEDEH